MNFLSRLYRNVICYLLWFFVYYQIGRKDYYNTSVTNISSVPSTWIITGNLLLTFSTFLEIFVDIRETKTKEHYQYMFNENCGGWGVCGFFWVFLFLFCFLFFVCLCVCVRVFFFFRVFVCLFSNYFIFITYFCSFACLVFFFLFVVLCRCCVVFVFLQDNMNIAKMFTSRPSGLEWNKINSGQLKIFQVLFVCFLVCLFVCWGVCWCVCLFVCLLACF